MQTNNINLNLHYESFSKIAFKRDHKTYFNRKSCIHSTF